jgi:hypothetical protein
MKHSRVEDEMETTFFHALIVLAAVPAAAQEMTIPNCSANGDPASAGPREYGAQVDGLLREVAASLQRAICRLETLVAIYDARPESGNEVGIGSESVAGDASTGARRRTHEFS